MTPKRALATCLILLFSSERRAVHVRIHGRIFAAFAGVGARAQQVHGLGNGLVRLRRQRTKGHGAGDKAMGDVARRVRPGRVRKLRAGGANLEQIAQMRGRGVDGLRGEVGERRERHRGALLRGPDHGLQRAHNLRLPAVRFGFVGLAEAHEPVVRQVAHLGGGNHRSLHPMTVLGCAQVSGPQLAHMRHRSARIRARRSAPEPPESTCPRPPAQARWRRTGARRCSCRGR